MSFSPGYQVWEGLPNENRERWQSKQNIKQLEHRPTLNIKRKNTKGHQINTNDTKTKNDKRNKPKQ